MVRQVISSGAPWESIVGYSRAVRVGNRIEVSGTAPIIDGDRVKEDDMYAQAKNCLEIIEEALKNAGASMKDVVRTRSYITDISRWEELK
jgi:enamine deaminase RidA (YjgF/YER057c/UK114 family)